MTTLQTLPKPYYRIGEVSRLLSLPPCTLRHWEECFAEFVRPVRALRGGKDPKPAMTNYRIYSRNDVVTLGTIKQLLHVEGYTTKGALAQLRRVRSERAAGA